LRPIRCCLADGSDLPDLLEGRTPVLDKASEWMSEHLKERVEIRPGEHGGRRFVLWAAGAADPLPLHLAGEGARSLLPVLLCACWAELERESGPSMLVVEEPESHLHPSLQIALLDRLIQTSNEGIPVVLETHSIYLLRALQRAVLQERIQPAAIGLHWVDDRADGSALATRIEITDEARLLGWSPESLEEEPQLSGEIMDLRWQRRSIP